MKTHIFAHPPARKSWPYAALLTGGALVLLACIVWNQNRAVEDHTREILIDTTGTRGFDLRRTFETDLAGRSDPLLLARESLLAQTGLCPKRFEIHTFAVTSKPPTVSYEARIRCF